MLRSHIFPDPPVITYRNNPSLKHKLVRAKLKPIDETDDSEATQPDQTTPKTTQELRVPIDYPYTIFKSSLQNF